MNVWTVNNIEERDLKIVGMVFNINNQDDDRVDITFGEPYDVGLSSMWLPGLWTTFRCNGSVKFRGKVDSFGSANASDMQESRSISVYGPWHFLAKNPMTQSHPYLNGNKTTTHVVLEGSANTVLTAILTAASAAGICGVGTVDVGNVVIPKMDLYDTSYAEAIRSVLKFIPGAQVCFDYASSLPLTCHILRFTSSHLQTVTINDADGETISNLKSTVLNDRVIQGVSLKYELPETRKTRTWYHKIEEQVHDETVSVDGLAYEGTDAAGTTTAGRNVLRRTIPLQGHRTITTINWQVQSSSISLLNVFYKTTAPDNWVWLDDFMIRNMARHLHIDRATPPTTVYKNMSGWAVSSLGSVPFPSNATEAAKWYLLERVWDPDVFVSFDYDRMPLRSIPPEILYSAAYAGLRIIEVEVEWSWTHATSGSQVSKGKQYFVYRGSAGLAGGAMSGTRTITEGEFESPPAGLAAALLADHSTILFDGSLTMRVEANPAMFFGKARKLVLSNLGITTPIQMITVDAATDLADLTFGPPNHLGPQERLTLLRARRPA